MHSLSVLFYDQSHTKPGRLIRWLGKQQYTHVAVQIGPAVAHTPLNKAPRWCRRDSIDKLEGRPCLELSLGDVDVNLTEVYDVLHEACPHPVTIRSVLLAHFTPWRTPVGCVTIAVDLLRYCGFNISRSIYKPDTLLECLNDNVTLYNPDLSAIHRGFSDQSV